MGQIWRLACKQAVAFQVEEDALEKMVQVEQSITPPFEHLEFVVQSFDKPAVFSVDEEVEDFIPPAVQGVEERIKTAQSTAVDVFDPSSDFGYSGNRREVLIKNGGQLLLQIIGLLQLGRVPEEQSEKAPFFGGQVSGFLAQDPQAAFQLFVLDGWKLLFQPPQFLFPQVI